MGDETILKEDPINIYFESNDQLWTFFLNMDSTVCRTAETNATPASQSAALLPLICLCVLPVACVARGGSAMFLQNLDSSLISEQNPQWR